LITFPIKKKKFLFSVLSCHSHVVHAVHCKSEWVANVNKTKCFQCIAKFKSWDQSEAYCKDHGGHLASLASLQELKFVQELCSKNFSGCWIGGRVNSSAHQGWIWSDNTSQHNDSLFPRVQFGLKCVNKPCYNTSDSCALLSYGVAPIKPEGCNNSHAFICMVNIGTTSLYDILIVLLL